MTTNNKLKESRTSNRCRCMHSRQKKTNINSDYLSIDDRILVRNATKRIAHEFHARSCNLESACMPVLFASDLK